jgi:hypothetical protein
MSKPIRGADAPTRVVYYVQPTPPTATVDDAARRRDRQLRYERWLTRQEALRRRDGTVRCVLLVIAIVIGVGLLTAAAVLAWGIHRTVTHLGDETLLAVPADLLRVRAGLADAVELAAGSGSQTGVGR